MKKENPPQRAKKAPAPPGRNGYKYRPQFGLIVPCRDEAHQEQLYNRLVKMGLSPRVVTV